ncbi:DNA polymerase X-like protein [Aureococcus anophagefferens]|nr:DNA polymerase X-like protein [Aureococcus anophagefferens]
MRKLWSERIGAGFVAVTSPEVLAGALARHADATHVVSCVRGHALVDRVRGDVGDARITAEGDVNKAVTGALADQMKWWDNGAVNADEFRLYATRIQLLHRVAPIIKSWPVTLTPENWDDEREKLEAQHYISATSTSATGGWIEYIEQLVLGGPAAVVREDCFYKWQRDPVRRVVFEINALKMHVGKKRAVDLVANRGVTSAAELCARRDDPALAIPPHVGLASTAVGSYRRGKVGGHDLDVMLHAPRARRGRDYEFHDGDGAGFRLLERFFARLAAIDVGGAPFLHPHRTMGGLIGAKEAPKLGIRHCRAVAAVPGAFRQVDFILCPTEIIAHGLLGWSGSTSFQRSLRDYVNHAHEKNWAEVPDRRPIVGRRGWNVTRDGTRVGSLIEGRELDEDEHWAWSQNGIAIARGKHSSKGKDGEQFETTYEECNINLRTEADVFRFFHLDYRAPHERCA